MKIVRRKRQQENRQKKILFCIIGFILVVLTLIIVTAVKNCNPVTEEKNKTDNSAAKMFAIMNEDDVSMEVNVGEMLILSIPDDFDQTKIEYTSSNENVVRVDAGGRTDALKKGQSVITITGPKFNSTCTINVNKVQKETTETDFSLGTDDEIITSAITANLEYAKRNVNNFDYKPYMIQVNRRTNVVTVYTYDDNHQYKVPVRAMICSCGTGGTDVTPTGEFSIYFKNQWHELFGNCWGQYVTGFNGDILFHSVPYFSDNNDDLETEEFNKLGEVASQGCVRMCVADAKWIFDNCDMETTVKVIDQSENADSLGKPNMIKLPSNVTWDPTDDDSRNPYLKKGPALSGVEDKEIKKGSKFDMLEGIKATDTCGNDITSEIKVTGNVIPDKKGTYYVTYQVKDGLNKKVDKTIKITVA